jgi:uncharacterized protein involved in exopolysaccharide biosynthesis
MSFTNKVDFIPKSPNGDNRDPVAMLELRKHQQQKWSVLVGVFLFISAIANIYIWTRPVEFQSQTIIHFSYPQQDETELSFVAEQQISLSQYRLTSNSVLKSLAQTLNEDSQFDYLEENITVEQLTSMLSAEASTTSRVITLKAKGDQAGILEPIIDQWLSLYLTQLNEENSSSNSEDAQLFQQKLADIEERVDLKRDELAEFSEANNIVSLERDENRILGQIKGLGKSVDAAEEQKTQSLSALESLNESIALGQQIQRPADKASIDAIKSTLKDLQEELSLLSEKYTQEYLSRDQAIVSKQQKAQVLAQELDEKIAESQTLYLQESQRELSTARNKSIKLQQQMAELHTQAQEFNQKLEQYRTKDQAIKELQNQAQEIRNQIVKQEVSRPFEARISVLEQAFTPDFPIGPNYWEDTLISLGIAIVLAILALLIFSFIVRQKSVTESSTNFVVMPTHPSLNPDAQLSQQSQLSSGSTPMQLTDNNEVNKNMRLLGVDECAKLYGAANKQGKLTIGLLLSGTSFQELIEVKCLDFTSNYSQLNIKGLFARTLKISSQMSLIIESICASLEPNHKVCSTQPSTKEFDQLVINAGHDAQLTFPEQLSVEVLRHTYLTYLVMQGARLNDLEQLAGYISPSELSTYRAVNRHGMPVDLGEINSVFPFIDPSTQ